MKWVFWASVAIIGYTYVGYVAWLWIRARFKGCPVRRLPHTPQLSVCMVVRDEAENLQKKISNLISLNYPAEKIEFVIISDGSSDSTGAILAQISDSRFHVLLLPEPQGKASGLNEALKVASGEIVLFTDARQSIECDGPRYLMENFADPKVGCASGELMLGDPASGEVAKGMGLYWRIEKAVRELESTSGSVVGATGAFYAARRELLRWLPPETILDDVYLPMQVLRQGHRVVFDNRARAWDLPNLGGKREFARKVRTLSGNYQLLQNAPWLLSSQNPIRFEFISHKLLRLVVPFALALALVTCFVLEEPMYRLALVLQLAFYSLSLLSLAHLKGGPLAKAADAAFTFVVLNTAAIVAFKNFVTGRRAAWVR
jgi:cellulose synthase/poly-beta-1,6-N-acetylglucosamine synthase-like glycosyltransferase